MVSPFCFASAFFAYSQALNGYSFRIHTMVLKPFRDYLREAKFLLSETTTPI